jgi:hypothetical protein
MNFATKNHGQISNKSNKRTKEKGKGGNKKNAYIRFTKCYRQNSSKVS